MVHCMLSKLSKLFSKLNLSVHQSECTWSQIHIMHDYIDQQYFFLNRYLPSTIINKIVCSPRPPLHSSARSGHRCGQSFLRARRLYRPLIHNYMPGGHPNQHRFNFSHSFTVDTNRPRTAAITQCAAIRPAAF